MGRQSNCPEPEVQHPVDLDHLRQFTRGDVTLETEIVELFRGHTREMIEKLSSTNDAAEWRICAHTIKGSARAIGAWRLSAAAERAEAAGVRRCVHALADLQRLFAEACAYLDAISPGQSVGRSLP